MNHIFIWQKTFFVCMSLFLSVLAFNVKSQTQIPKIIPPSPEAAALFKYQDYPMDYSTGVPRISIPLYELQCGSLSVPISLSYHASGRRVSDIDGPIAVGWNLNAGGMISRTVYGSEDFGKYKFPYPFNINNIHPINDLDYLKEIVHWEYYQSPGYFKDSEYDVFSYSVNNLSGKFIFSDNNNVKTAELIPNKPYLITPKVGATGLNGIEMIDDKGVFYSFAANEIASVYSSNVYTGYSLQKMISADKSDTIFFEYSVFTQTRTSISKQWIVDDHPDGAGGSAPLGYSLTPTEVENKNRDNYQVARLVRIRFNQGSVVFNLETNGDKVDNIQIMNLDNETISTIQLSRSVMNTMSDGNPPTYKLNDLIFKGKENTNTGKYSFEYYPITYPQGYSNMDYRHCDYWGYYNASGALKMVPYHTGINFVDFLSTGSISVGDQSTNREPNLNALKSGVLKKITYPTGGSTEFVYENNQYLSLQTNQITLGPGLRVSKMVSNAGNGLLNSRVFTYGIGECGYTSIEVEPVLNTMSYQLNYKYLACSTCLGIYFSPKECAAYRKRFFLSDFIPELSALASRPLIYKEVTEYNGTLANNIGKTVYTYDYYPWGVGGMPYGLKHIPDWNYWNNPSLLTQSFFRKKNSGYQKVKEVVNGYSIITLKNVQALHVKRIWSIPQNGRQSCSEPVNTDVETYSQYNFSGVGQSLGPSQIYSFSGYTIPIGVKNLASTYETIFNEDGSFVDNSTSFTYNDRQLVSKTARTISGGGTFNQLVKYPFDYAGNSVLSLMASPALNMVNFPVEQIESRNTVHSKSIRYNYFNWGNANAMIAPQTIDTKNGTKPYETMLRYVSYDGQGNPAEFLKENDIKHTYIWDYQLTYPVVEAVNAENNEIAYTSFEADGNGHWSGLQGSNVRTDVKGITGNKYVDLSGITLTKSALNSSTTYIVSYWSRTGSGTVTGISKSGWPKQLQTTTINGITWNYWEHRVSGVTSISLSGSIAIDELRLYPENARMTTYTYDPLVGMTSKTDENNIVGYFEYDASGRLKFIRDAKWNIVKMLKYNQQNK